MYAACSDVEAFALNKNFMLGKIFPKYPEIYREIKDDSRYRYTTSIKDMIIKHKVSHIDSVNKRTFYNNVAVTQKLIEASNASASAEGPS